MIIGLLTDSTFQEDPRNSLYGGRDCRKESRDLHSSGLSFCLGMLLWTHNFAVVCLPFTTCTMAMINNTKKFNLNMAGNNVKYLIAGTW